MDCIAPAHTTYRLCGGGPFPGRMGRKWIALRRATHPSQPAAPPARPFVVKVLPGSRRMPMSVHGDAAVSFGNDCLQTWQRTVPWVWDGLVAQGAVTLLSAPEKAGK